jgi:adenylate kinase family enzyme
MITDKKPHRIMIFGRPGSGKSTFAYLLSKKLNVPLYHLDKHFYKEKWVERPYQEFLDIQQTMIDSPSWIIDGNNTRSLESRYRKADLVIYFNYPRYICYYRIFKRLFFKNSALDDRAPECPETVRFSLLKYMWSFEKRIAHQIEKLKNNYPDTRFIEIKSDRQLATLIKTLS